jgi:hypothetical protein
MAAAWTSTWPGRRRRGRADGEHRRREPDRGDITLAYIDGIQPNCAWTGTPGNSTSVWTVGTVAAPTLADRLVTQTGQSPLASQTEATIGSALSIPLNQTLTLYAVHTTPATSQRAALRTSTSADRFATGRNSGAGAWVAIGTDSAAASVNGAGHCCISAGGHGRRPRRRRDHRSRSRS